MATAGAAAGYGPALRNTGSTTDMATQCCETQRSFDATPNGTLPRATAGDGRGAITHGWFATAGTARKKCPLGNIKIKTALRNSIPSCLYFLKSKTARRRLAH